MKIVLLFQLFVVLIISACSSGTSESTGTIDQAPACPTGAASYVGCWDTPGCQKLPLSGSGNERWAVDRIYLTADDTFNIYRMAYANSSCNGPLAFSDYGSTYNFSVVAGPVDLGSSLIGYELDVDANSTSYTVFLAATTVDTLCLSTNWDVMDAGFKFIFEDGTAADLTNCLEKFIP